MKNKKLRYRPQEIFKVPENYFRDFEERMMLDLQEEACLKNSYKGSPGFTLPPEFMDTLEDQILMKLEAQKGRGKLRSLLNNPRNYYAAAVAAVFIGIISTIFFSPVVNELSIDSIELSILEHYIDEGNIDLNFNEISTYITEEGYSLETVQTTELNDEAVFTYLMEQVEDPSFLYE